MNPDELAGPGYGLWLARYRADHPAMIYRGDDGRTHYVELMPGQNPGTGSPLYPYQREPAPMPEPSSFLLAAICVVVAIGCRRAWGRK